MRNIVIAGVVIIVAMSAAPAFARRRTTESDEADVTKLERSKTGSRDCRAVRSTERI